MEQFSALCSEKLSAKTAKVPVSGPWHSHYLTDARLAFDVWAADLSYQRPKIPLILNANAQTEYHPDTIKHLNGWQLQSPVFWADIMSRMRNMGVDIFVEIGPGKLLSGLLRANGFSRSVKSFAINQISAIGDMVRKQVS